MGNSDQHLVTIPQVFYDIIARVLPGCLFLFVLRFEFSAANLRFARIIGSPNGSLGSSIVNGIGYLVLWGAFPKFSYHMFLFFCI